MLASFPALDQSARVKPFLFVLIPLLLAASSAQAPEEILVTKGPFLAEGLAADGAGHLLVSGVVGRTVLRQDRGTFSEWLKPGKDEPVGGLFGMAADRKRDRLWIAETFGSDVPGGSGSRSTGLLEVRLSDGLVIARHRLQPDDRDRWIGDVAVGADGTVYASDAKGGGLYVMKPRAERMRLIQTALKSPQGLVESADGKALIVADYSTGLHRIDLASGADFALPGGAIRGVDGLKRNGRSLVGTYNGAQPNRIVRIKLSPKEDAVTSIGEVANGSPNLDDVSLLTVVGDRIVAVAHSQWNEVDGTNRLVEPRPIVLMTMRLTGEH